LGHVIVAFLPVFSVAKDMAAANRKETALPSGRDRSPDGSVTWSAQIDFYDNLTPSADCDGNDPLRNGLCVLNVGGRTNAGKTWLMTD
jgi:hypothetical protein